MIGRNHVMIVKNLERSWRVARLFGLGLDKVLLGHGGGGDFSTIEQTRRYISDEMSIADQVHAQELGRMPSLNMRSIGKVQALSKPIFKVWRGEFGCSYTWATLQPPWKKNTSCGVIGCCFSCRCHAG